MCFPKIKYCKRVQFSLKEGNQLFAGWATNSLLKLDETI